MQIRLYSLAVFAASVPLFAAGLPDVLARMDSAAGKFSGMSADLEKVDYTKVIDDKSVEDGTILVKRVKPHELQVKIAFTKPAERYIALHGQTVELYSPKIKTVEEYDLGKRSDLANSVLFVGFGMTSKELQANYKVTLLGEEKVAGQNAEHLQLIPKPKELKNQFDKIELWMAEDGTVPVQQKVVLPSGDYKMFTYSNIRYNPPLTEEALSLNLPKNVKRTHPQK